MRENMTTPDQITATAKLIADRIRDLSHRKAATMDDFGLEEAVDRLGEGVVVTVTDAADRWFDACLGQSLGELDRQVLRSAVAMMDQPHSLERAAFMDGRFKGIDDESDIDEPLPCGDMCEVRSPQHLGRRRPELAVHLVRTFFGEWMNCPRAAVQSGRVLEVLEEAAQRDGDGFWPSGGETPNALISLDRQAKSVKTSVSFTSREGGERLG